jgi:uncharacterized protein YbbC (DUF1343 family)
MGNTKKSIILGIEKLVAANFNSIEGMNVGLICNQSSVTHSLKHSADVLFGHNRFSITALFGPQHGIRGEVQDNMIETPHTTDRKTGLPVHSLYSETRYPTKEMLGDLDALIFDMQDVGCRVYTFIYTMANCMVAAAEHGLKVVVCDRPNPVNGMKVEGNTLCDDFKSFVGQYPIPMRHGMTVGELARLFNDKFDIGCNLEVVKMEGWSRETWFDETDAPWVMPSPNMPTTETATVFPGTVYLEGTLLSEGRGTTRPFEIVGAPYVNSIEFANYLNGLHLEGVFFRECGFQPTFQKHTGKMCGGVQIHVIDRNTFKPVITGVAVMKAAIDLYNDKFEWKQPPYEYIYDKLPIDVIAGTDNLRKGLENGQSLENLSEAWEQDETNFRALRNDYLLY